MGYEADGLGLFADWATDDARVGAWLGPDTIVGLLAPLRADGDLAHATHYWVDDLRAHPLPPAGELDALAATWRRETIAIYAGDLHDPDWLFQVGLARRGPRLAFGLGRAHVGADTQARLRRLIDAWTAALAPTGCALTLGTVVPSTPYRRPRPPRDSAWTLGAIDYFLGRGWHDADPERREVLARIVAAPLPPDAVRRADGEVVHVGFVAQLDQPASVAAARARSEAWLSPLVPGDVAPGWNPQGDRLVEVIDRVDLAPFTYFDADNRTGYKALIVDPDSQAVDGEAWDALAAIAASGQAPDGTAVDRVALIVPRRADAVAVLPRARAAGVACVAYPADHALWEVDPPDEAA